MGRYAEEAELAHGLASYSLALLFLVPGALYLYVISDLPPCYRSQHRVSVRSVGHSDNVGRLPQVESRRLRCLRVVLAKFLRPRNAIRNGQCGPGNGTVNSPLSAGHHLAIGPAVRAPLPPIYPCSVPNEKVPGGVVHKLPADLRTALVANSTALEAWRDITPLARNEFICWVEDAKQAKTRERRIRRTQEELEEGKRRPCCWPGCKHRERTGKP